MKRSSTSAVGITLAILMLVGCVDLLHEEPAYQPADIALCDILSSPLQDTLVVIDTTGGVSDTVLVISDAFLSVAMVRVDNLDSMWVSAHDSLVAATYDTVIYDTLLRVALDRPVSSYGFLEVPAGRENFVIGVSDAVDARLVGEDTVLHAPQDSAIAIATLAECYADLNTRLVFDVAPGRYLLRLDKSETMKSPTFMMAIIKQ